MKKPSARSWTLISLFSGIGGLDEGLHRAGFKPLFCAELDENANQSLRKWCDVRRVKPIVASDIYEVNALKLRRQLGLEKGELDLLAGGPPCQSFSLMGKRKALDDDRGMLLLKMVEFAKVFRPKAVLVEQVKGLLSAKGPDGKSGSVLNQLVTGLSDLGYSITYDVLRAADYGVPQLRDRLIVVGLAGSKRFIFPEPTHLDEKSKNGLSDLFSSKSRYLTLRDCIGDLPKPVLKGEKEEIPSHVDATPNRDRERINGVPEGQCLARQLHLSKNQRQKLDPEKDTTKFRRLAWDKPALTLRCGEAFYHPTENRYLTPFEYLRIHGFSDDHPLIGPIRGRTGTVRVLDQHRLVANAVPPPLAEVVGRAIIDHLKADHKADLHRKATSEAAPTEVYARQL